MRRILALFAATLLLLAGCAQAPENDTASVQEPVSEQVKILYFHNDT